MERTSSSQTIREYIVSIMGGIIYATGINVIITPFGLYNGNITGVAQMLNTVMTDLLQIAVPNGLNLTGILLALLNTPLVLISAKVISRPFFYKTVLTVFFQTVAMSVIPIPAAPLVDDILVSCILGGVVAGFGAGISLRAGGSGGGADIIGVYCIRKYPGFSVGRISQLIGAVVYCFCLFMYDINAVIYSASFTFIYSYMIDRVHFQNIKTSVMIFSKEKKLNDYVIHTLRRGATLWNGSGAYTQEPVNICMTLLSKHEAALMRKEFGKIDPSAFIVFNDNVELCGNFENRS